MVVDRAAGTIAHRTFADIVELIEPRDVLVVNRTRVFRARLLGTRASGAPAEILLLKSLGDGEYEAMVSPGGKLKPGRRVDIAPGFSAEILEVTERRTRIVRLESDLPLDDAIERFGHVPLPPYIERPDAPSDAERYQTVFARESGVRRRADRRPALHVRAARRARRARRRARRSAAARRRRDVQAGRGRRSGRARHALGVVLGVGRRPRDSSTSVARPAVVCGRWERRACARWRAPRTTTDGFVAGSGETSIFIRPPERVRSVDCVVTNFHLPRSTLIMLVAAIRRIRSDDARLSHSRRRRISVLFLRRRDGDRLTRLHAPQAARDTIRVFYRRRVGAARAGTFATPHGVVDTPAFMAVGTLATVKSLDPDRPSRDRRADDSRERVSSASASGRRADSRFRRSALVHGMGWSDPHRLGRLSSILTRGLAHGEERRRRVSQPHRRIEARLHARERDADRAQSRRGRDHAVRSRHSGAE